MNAVASPTPAAAGLRTRYAHAADPRSLLGPHTLAVFGFGGAAPRTLDDPRYLHVGLEPLHAPAPFEVWESHAIAIPFRDGAVSGARAGGLSFGWLEREEPADGIRPAAEDAYRTLLAHLRRDPHPQLLRVWNYLDAITEGAGDAERYRQFCVGRAAGFALRHEQLPAATAIGRHDGRRVLQVYWLSAANAGRPLENPRQVAAYHYPRDYGPRPPSFARAMLAAPGDALPLLLSGTAAVVGHASRHPGDLAAQLDETFRNFDALLDAARQRQPALPARFGPDSLLKVYVRDAAALAPVEALLRAHLPDSVPRLLLHAEVCRRELLVEIDGFHGG